MNETKAGGVHRAWMVLVGACLLYGGSIGLLGNTAGIFIAPVMKEMGWSLQSTIAWMSIMPLVGAVFQLVAGRVFDKVNFQVLMIVLCVMFACAYIYTGYTYTTTGWNVFGILYGIAFGFIAYLPIPMLMGNWFKDKMGLALGIAVASASVVAAIGNPLGGWLIEVYGWRTARLIFGIASMVMTVPALIFFIRKTPEEVGIKPYGAEKAAGAAGGAVQITGMKSGPALKTAPIWLFFVMAGIIVFCASMHQQTPRYATFIGIDPVTAATASSVIMIGGIAGKVFLGWLNDKAGVLGTLICAMAVGALGCIVIWVSGINITPFFIGAAMFGVGYAALTVVPPLLVRKIYGQRNFTQIYSTITFGLCIFSSLAPKVYAWLYDTTQSYSIHWKMVMTLFIIAGVIGVVGYAIGKPKKWAELTD